MSVTGSGRVRVGGAGAHRAMRTASALVRGAGSRGALGRMTTGGEPGSEAVTGRIFTIGARAAVCVLPLPSSMPIPLDVIRPAAVDLLTWAFVGLGEDGPGARARCLLALVARDAEARARLVREGHLTLAMHFRELPVALTQAAPDALPAPDELRVLARAVLSAVTPETIAALSDLAPLVGRSAADLPIDDEAPELTLCGNGRGASLLGKTVPNYLLTRSGDDLTLARVAAARLRFGRQPRSDLTLDPLWGPGPGPAIDGAILLGSGSFTAARVRPG